MANRATLTQSYTLGGKTYNEARTVESDKVLSIEKTLPAAKAGDLTTRTSDTVGELTMDVGHGFVDGDLIDLYWAGGSRRSVVVGTVAVNAVPISGGLGDNLPADESEITAMVQTEEAFNFDGDNVKALVFSATAPATLILAGDDDVEDFARVFKEANAAYGYRADGPDVNPIAGDDVTKVFLSHGDSSGAKVVRVAVLFD
jgi:hypothetical protein